MQNGSLRISLRSKRFGTLSGALLVTTVLLAAPAAAQKSANWPMFGQNASNTANQPNETTISPGNVASLSPKWIYTAQGDISARPAAVNGVAYFPDWGGYLHALNVSPWETYTRPTPPIPISWVAGVWSGGDRSSRRF
jgi:hypothetical protein